MFSDVSLEQLRKALADFASSGDCINLQTPRTALSLLCKKTEQLSESFRGRDALDVLTSPVVEKHALVQQLSQMLLCMIQLADMWQVDLGKAVLETLPEWVPEHTKNPLQLDKQARCCLAEACIDEQMLHKLHSQRQWSGRRTAWSPPSSPQQQQTVNQLPHSQLSSCSSCGTGRNQISSTANLICSLPPASQQQHPNLCTSICLNQPARMATPQALAPTLSTPQRAYVGVDAAVAGVAGHLGAYTGSCTGRLQQQLGAVLLSSASPAATMLHSQAPQPPQMACTVVKGSCQQQQHCCMAPPVIAMNEKSVDALNVSSDDEVAEALLPHSLLEEIGYSQVKSSISGDKNSRLARDDSIDSPAANYGMDVDKSAHGGCTDSHSSMSSSSANHDAMAGATEGAPRIAAAASSLAVASSLWLTSATLGDSVNSECIPSDQTNGFQPKDFPPLGGHIATQRVKRDSCNTVECAWSWSYSSGELPPLHPSSANADNSETTSPGHAAATHHEYARQANSKPATDAIVDTAGRYAVTCMTSHAGPTRGLQNATMAAASSECNTTDGGPRVTPSGVQSLSEHEATCGHAPSPPPPKFDASDSSDGGSRCEHVPVVSLTAAVAAAKAADAKATVKAAHPQPVQEQEQQLLNCCDLCSRCGGMHTGKCPPKAKCLRCLRKAHLGDCWTRCASCNLIHATGKCKLAASRCVVGVPGQQQQKQQRWLPKYHAATGSDVCCV